MANLTEQDNEFRRARLMPKAIGGAALEEILGPAVPENILWPLHRTRGIIFPYTPSIQWASRVDYQEYHMTHSNYKYNAFEKSAPGPFQMDAVFTAQTDKEARYLLAVMHFLKSSTKMYFGEKAGELAGVPPPILRFRYLGQYMFNDVPVIIKSYQYALNNDVDYVPVRFSEDHTRDTFVPTQINISIELDIQMNTKTVRKEFDLASFTDGSYVNNGGFKGWI